MYVWVSCSTATAVNRSLPWRSAWRAICLARLSASARVSSRTRSTSRCESERKISQPNSAMTASNSTTNTSEAASSWRDR